MEIQSSILTFSSIENTLDNLVFSQVKTISDGIISKQVKPLIYVLALIYLSWHGWKIWFGTAGIDLREFLLMILKFAIVITLATDASGSLTFLINKIHEIPNHLLNIVVAGANNQDFPKDVQFIDRALSTNYEVYSKLMAYANTKGSGIMPDLETMSFAIGTLGIGIVSACVGAGILFVAKFSLSILLAVGCLFFLFFLFETTRGYFMSWVNYVLMCILLILFVALAARINYGVCNAALKSLPDIVQDDSVIISYINLPLASFLGLIFFGCCPMIASSLSSGGSLNMSNHLSDATERSLRGVSRKTVYTVKNSFNRRRGGGSNSKNTIEKGD